MANLAVDFGKCYSIGFNEISTGLIVFIYLGSKGVWIIFINRNSARKGEMVRNNSLFFNRINL